MCHGLGMARLLRVEYPGAIYHVTCRMIGGRRFDRSRLFVDDNDRERLLDRLADRVDQYNIRLYLFVFMTTHFHLAFETPQANCSRFMHSLLTAYTVYYNRRHRRHGHLLDGRFKAKLVGGDDYLLKLTRYVHLNPVKVGSIKKKPVAERIQYLRRYRWSTYQSYTGRRRPFDFVEYGPILAQMKGRRRDWPKRYRQFVEAGVAENDEEFKKALTESPRSIGDDEFCAFVDELYQKLIEDYGNPEDVSFRHIIEPLPVDVILGVAAAVLGVDVERFGERRRSSALRAVAGRMLIRFGGLTQREAARHLNIGTGGAMSAQVRRLPSLLTKNKRLRECVVEIEDRLEQKRAGKKRRR